MSVVNQFSGAKRRDRGNTKLSGRTTTEHFDFLSSENICFSMPSEAFNSSCFHQRQPVSQVFYYYLFQFYKPSFCPLTNCVLAKLNKFNDFLTRKTQYMTTYEKYHEHIQVAKCYSLQIGLWTLDLKKGDLIILYQVKKEKPAELLVRSKTCERRSFQLSTTTFLCLPLIAILFTSYSQLQYLRERCQHHFFLRIDKEATTGKSNNSRNLDVSCYCTPV